MWYPSDLYLACALTLGVAAALVEFETRYMPIVAAAVSRLHFSATQLDELRQIVRVQLFTAAPGARPRIADYSGKGELGAWVRVSALRAGLKMIRRPGEALVEDDELARAPALQPDPERSYVKGISQAAFRAAFREALGGLPAVEQNVLRQHYLDRLTLDQIGALEQAHRTTVARWLRDARRALLLRTRKILMLNTQATPSECDSLIRQARSRFDVTLDTLLR